ncbi:Ribonuclease H [Abeliophyllum distichum]|uniref:Ribonuclease H n=1 Tax=Abeliophyllum distichum TaxID=126358 RepID=A0ABD1Q336_9LAMI
MRKKKGMKQSYTRPEEEKEMLDCCEDDDDKNLLFTNYLKAMEIPANFWMPLMDKYNGRGDPSDHINIYKTKLQGQSPAMKYRNFHTTLASDVKRWYNKLKPGSIRSWPQLKREFVNAFIGNRTMIANIAQLNDIRQKEGETVKSYFKRFSNVINKIETVTNEKALDALVTGLHMHTSFWRHVQNSQPKTYSQLVDLVQCEIWSEETIENREKVGRERENRYRRFNQPEVVPVPILKCPQWSPYRQHHHPSSVVYTGLEYITLRIVQT